VSGARQTLGGESVPQGSWGPRALQAVARPREAAGGRRRAGSAAAERHAGGLTGTGKCGIVEIASGVVRESGPGNLGRTPKVPPA
jgi:hypothetical protein